MGAQRRVAGLICVAVCGLGAGASASAARAPSVMGPLLPESFLGGRATPSSVGAERKPAGNPVAGTPTCQKPGAEYECYGPVQVRTAYAFASLINHGEDGRGRTIAIIDAYQDLSLIHI